MRIRCIETSFRGLPAATQSIFGYSATNALGEEFLGTEFSVLAMGFWEQTLWYYIVSNGELLPIPAALCEVVQSKLDGDKWSIAHTGGGDSFGWYASVEMLSTPSFEDFYNSLLQGELEAKRQLDAALKIFG